MWVDRGQGKFAKQIFSCRVVDLLKVRILSLSGKNRMNAIDEIKNQIDIVDIVSETVKLRRTGKNYIGFCPFHSNTKTPAFVVFPESGTWKCFGQCAEGGDVFNFVMKKQGWDFQQTLEYLAKRAGVQLDQIKKEDPAKKKERENLFELMNQAVLYYQNNLTQNPAGKPALDYLATRGLTRDTIEKFQIGFALASWDAMTRHLLSKEFSENDLIQTGMVSEQRDDKGEIIPNGRKFDRFRNRIMIPIRDSQGNPIAFGARKLDPNDTPKFLNSPQTVLFDKGRTVFALSEAKKSIREKNAVVIVEGYMDVIVLHQAGFTNTVSPMGTALTEFQVQQLSRHTDHVILALDADAAGENAAIKGIDVIRDAYRSSRSKSGLSRTGGADIRITTIPDGMDPDEVVLRDPEEWKQILANAKPYILHLMETAAIDRDITDARTKSDIAAEILPKIYEIPDVIERETYRQQLAQFLNIDESLLKYSPAVKKAAVAEKSAFPEKPNLRQNAHTIIFDPRESFQNKETAILRYLYQYYDTPGMVSSIDRLLREYRLPPLSEADFEQSDLHEIAKYYFSGINQDEELNTKRYIAEKIPDAVRTTFEKITKPVFSGTVDLPKLNEDIARSVAFMRQEKTDYLADEIRTLVSSETNDAATQKEYQQLLDQTIINRRFLDSLIESINRINYKEA